MEYITDFLNGLKRRILLSWGAFFVALSICPGQSLTHIYISEFMASNSQTLQDADGEYSDWIELYNPTDALVNLDGWYLSDDPNELIKWPIPAVSIAPHGFLVIFASAKDRKGPEFHTNFKLSSDGEWLLLVEPDGNSVLPPFTKPFPHQHANISYGYINGSLAYFDMPTPGSPNVVGNYVSPPGFSVDHGFFDHPFAISIIPSTITDSILYTTDGSLPAPGNGNFYQTPINVDSTLVLRAAAKRQGKMSEAVTATYVFPEKVKNQPFLPPGYPDTWGPFSTIIGDAPADYGMDPDICLDPAYSDQLVAALTSVPTISLVADKNSFFSLDNDENTGGIYTHTDPPTGGLGKDWERAVSVEYFSPENSSGFQVNCGIRIQGGHSRVPEKNPKHSFRLVFRENYGPGKLNFDLFGEGANDSFNTIILRAGFNQVWTHWDASQRDHAQYVHDSWAKDMFRSMGHYAARNKFVHLYINGLYWGLYNISERPDAEYMAHYLGGSKEDWDVIKDYVEVADGDINAWNTMMQLAKKGLADNAAYYAIQGKDATGKDDPSLPAYIDVSNLIDYMILNFYAGNSDWDHHNWVAARNRVDETNGFICMPWDTERIFNGKSENTVAENNENRLSFVYSELRKNPHFRKRFAERANEILAPDGLMGPAHVKAVYQKRIDEINTAIIAESARWGDYRRDVHPYNNEPYRLYTKNDAWLKEYDRLMNDYFPVRSAIVLDQLKTIGLAGDVVAGVDDLPDMVYGIAPNPFSNTVEISFKIQGQKEVSLAIYTADGRLVHHSTLPRNSEDTAKYSWKPDGQSPGIYILKISSSHTLYTGKIAYQP